MSKKHIVYKKLLPNIRFDFNELVWNFELDPLSTKVVRESFLLKVTHSSLLKIDQIREELMKNTNHRLTNCDIYSSLSSQNAGTPFHRDREPVIILNTFGRICYNIYNFDNTENVILEEGDAIYIPSFLGHAAIPLSPRISLSYECEE